jgi:undecaprenyl-phosphate 4-deoxy-4-formamido-L-arabinose transferase
VDESAEQYLHEVSVVVPVYRGELTLPALVAEIAELTQPRVSSAGHRFVVTEVLLVHDNGPDGSAGVIRELAAQYPFVRAVWLSRNFGQHAATLAGIASSASPWVATLDEDGQHVPADIGVLLDVAMRDRVPLVYGHHAGGAPHARWRNVASAAANRIGRWLAGSDLPAYSSFRLVLGAPARSVAAYCGQRTFLDAALTWAIGRSSIAEVSTRSEGRVGSGYSFGKLLSHFWTLVLSTGTRPLRLVSLFGTAVAMAGFGGAVYIVARKVGHGYDAPGWASVIVTLLLMGGLILIALGVLAEYVGSLLKTAQGRPLYVIVDDPADGPLSQA